MINAMWILLSTLLIITFASGRILKREVPKVKHISPLENTEDNDDNDELKIPLACLVPKRPGHLPPGATKTKKRYFYDKDLNKCQLFEFYGDGGNENNFLTEVQIEMQNLGQSLYNNNINNIDQNFVTVAYNSNQCDNSDLSTFLGGDWNQNIYQQSCPISIIDNSVNYANEAQFYLNPHHMGQTQSLDQTSVSPASEHQMLCGSISNIASPSDSGVSDCSGRTPPGRHSISSSCYGQPTSEFLQSVTVTPRATVLPSTDYNNKKLLAPLTSLPSNFTQGQISDVDYLKTMPSRKRRKTAKSACPDDASVVSGDEEMIHQSIKFMEFQREQWHKLCDINGKEIAPLVFQVIADKGFIFSPFDNAFINQKKNHFQVSTNIEISGKMAPKFVQVINGSSTMIRPIKEFLLDFYGVKTEMLNSIVQIKQSQSDRKPTVYEPVRLELLPNRVTKVTVGRLHFNETTLNNQRKNQRPNPDQKYFYLIASLSALISDSERYTVAALHSEQIIVRASNPGQFDISDTEPLMQKGKTPNSLYFVGPVGIGTDQPTTALAVSGDIQYTGSLFHPSDGRLKENIVEIDYNDALTNLAQIRIVTYDLKPDEAAKLGVPEEQRHRVGVIAQEVALIVPDAVKNEGEFLTVDDNRIFYESVAAVKELCQLTGNLECKIGEVEKISKKLSKLSRLDSLRSSATSIRSFVIRRPSVPSTVAENPEVKAPTSLAAKLWRPIHKKMSVNPKIEGRLVVGSVICLIMVLMTCLAVLTTLLIMDHARKSDGGRGGVNSDTLNRGWMDKGKGDWMRFKEKFRGKWKGKNHKFPWHGRRWPPPPPPLPPDDLMDMFDGRPPLPPPPAMLPAFEDNGPFLSYKRKFLGVPILYACKYANPRKCMTYCCRDPFISFKIVDNGSFTDDWSDPYSNLYSSNDQNPTNSSEMNTREIIIRTKIVDQDRDFLGYLKPQRRKGTTSPTSKFLQNADPIDKDVEKISDDLVSDVIDQMMSDKGDTINPLSRQKRKSASSPWQHNTTGLDIGEVSVQMSSFDSTLNITLDARYVADEEKEGNLSYYVPFSEYMPLMPVILKFNLEADLNVEFCPAKFLPVGSLCPVLENIFKMTNATFTVRKLTTNSTSWQLPIGFFQLSAYKFRMGMGRNLCSLSDVEVLTSFVEYNFVFYRLCSMA